MIRTFLLLVSLMIVACTPRHQQVATTKPSAPPDSTTLAENCRIMAGQYYEADQLDTALDYFTRATELNPLSPQAWHGRASTLSRMLRHDEAQAAYDVAIRLKPDYVAAIWHRGCDHSVNLQRDSALADLRLAIRLDSTVKQDALQDKCYQWLWADSEFLKIVK